jgi:N-methylhydantoinase B
MAEIEGPVRILAFEFLQDSAGPGRFRGGASFRRDYEMKEEEGTMQIRNDRCTQSPFGLYGGKPGRRGRNVLNPGGSREELLPGKVTRIVRKGEIFRYEQAGAGGWGDPLERDVERVLSDVRNEYVSPEMARVQYGVVIDSVAWSVDEDATADLRSKLRARPGTAPLPFVDRGELPSNGLQLKNEHVSSRL